MSDLFGQHFKCCLAYCLVRDNVCVAGDAGVRSIQFHHNSFAGQCLSAAAPLPHQWPGGASQPVSLARSLVNPIDVLSTLKLTEYVERVDNVWCVCLADAFLKAAIALLPDVPRSIEVDGRLRSSEPLLLDFLRNLLSTLLLFPVSV